MQGRLALQPYPYLFIRTTVQAARVLQATDVKQDLPVKDTVV